MLRFFRKIRQRLLSDSPPDRDSRAGKFSKYFLYVIVEIIIVIVGILIALQVDTWNEQQKEEDLYRTYLVRLKADYDEKLTIIELVKTKGDELVSLARYLTDYLNGGLNSLDTLKLAVAMEKSAGLNPIYLSIPTYAELSSTGRLAIIENDSLKYLLNGWHEYAKWREGQQTEVIPWVARYRDLIRNTLVTEDKMFIINSWWRPYPDHPIWDSLHLETSGTKITQGLSGNPDILGLLNDILIFRTVYQDLIENEKEYCLEMIELIESEINRLKE